MKIAVRAWRFFWLLALVSLLPKPSLGAETTSEFIALGQKISSQYGNRLWPGFSQTAFPVLLLDKTEERFFCPVVLPKGFAAQPIDPATKCPVFSRNNSGFSRQMKASFPFAGSGPVVVMGAPEFSDSNPAAWIATLIHEHFHQYQMNYTGYYQQLKALDLQGDDETGVWALEYAFAYQDEAVGAALTQLSTRLVDILAQTDRQIAKQKALQYAHERPAILGVLSEPDRRYLEFQLWQEGVARYTELVMAEHTASGGFSIAGGHDFAALAANLRERITQTLQQAELAKHQRVYFYSLGAAESLVLDTINPIWRSDYFESGLSLGYFFAQSPSVDGGLQK
ncbi:hypothetical protein MNBD_ALPHA06-825 [hydrothermal vent metagenome]|uniref:Uncharacterized protein n=1 Tax=hydrothermal vent metagenome TaxID=652676 RepID=A0A3B0RMZ7_9ZZZZ